jgi:hypothetical protein
MSRTSSILPRDPPLAPRAVPNRPQTRESDSDKYSPGRPSNQPRLPLSYSLIGIPRSRGSNRRHLQLTKGQYQPSLSPTDRYLGSWNPESDLRWRTGRLESVRNPMNGFFQAKTEPARFADGFYRGSFVFWRESRSGAGMGCLRPVPKGSGRARRRVPISWHEAYWDRFKLAKQKCAAGRGLPS